MSRLIYIALILITSTGCLQRMHVPDPPTKEAPLAERKSFYKKYHAISTTTRVTASVSRSGHVSVNERMEYLQLANGDRVYHPSDIKHVVAPETASGRGIESFEKLNEWSMYMLLGSALSIPVIGGASLVVIATGSALSGAGVGGIGNGISLIGVGGLLLGAPTVFIGTILGYWIISGMAKRERESVFLTYNVSLEDQLGLLE